MQVKLLQQPSVIQKTFVCLFFSMFMILNIVVGVYLVYWWSLVSIVQFFIFQLINIGVAYGATEFMLSILLPEQDLPRLEKLVSAPRVALLYVTCDDVVLNLLARLGSQTYPHYDVHVLDDSLQSDCIENVNASGFNVVRRHVKSGFKAGNLNHWLTLHGKTYKYFVVVDSDSLLSPDFLDQMVRYAEHPANDNVAILQSKIKIWNLDNPFARTMAAWFPIWLYPNERLGNLCDTILSWGHNCLYRTDILLSIGGFDEKFIAEDYATGAKLLRAGYKCRLINVVSYEAMPASHKPYARRALRWAKQTIQLCQLETDGLPMTTRLHIVANLWSFAVWMFYVPGMLLAIWGAESTVGDLVVLVRLLVTGEFVHTSLLPPVVIMVCYNVYFLVLRYPTCVKLGMTHREYWGTLGVLLSLGPYLAVPLAVGQLRSILWTEAPVFTITPKFDAVSTARQDLFDMWHVFLLIGIVLLGLMRNPISIVFNASWVLPLCASPVVLLWVRRMAARQGPMSPSSLNERIPLEAR